MTPPEQAALASELAQLRGDVGQISRDIGDVKTAVAVLVERSTRTDQDVRDLRSELEEETRAVRNELETLKKVTWVSVGAALVLGGSAGTVAQLVGR